MNLQATSSSLQCPVQLMRLLEEAPLLLAAIAQVCVCGGGGV